MDAPANGDVHAAVWQSIQEIGAELVAVASLGVPGEKAPDSVTLERGPACGRLILCSNRGGARLRSDVAAIRADPIAAWSYIDPGIRHDTGDGPLAGSLLGVKDIIDVEGMPTSGGFPPYTSARAERDAAAVSLLRAAGAHVVGKTVTTEFAGPTPTGTLNPLDHGRTPGGSSSGSAAAVAAGMVDLALGTQTAGSLIRPAAYCGVVGFKPSFGFINPTGVLPLAPSLDTVGVIARSVADSADAAYAAAGWPRPVPADPSPPRKVMLCWTDVPDQAAQDAHAALRRVHDRLLSDGTQVREMDWDEQLADADVHHRVIMVTEAARSLAPEIARFKSLLSPQLQEMLREGRAIERETYAASLRWAEAARVFFDRLLGDYDALLTFPAPGQAPRGIGSTGSYRFNSTWTLLHVPCVTVPVGPGENGMPLGVQVVGPRGNEAAALRCARWIEHAMDSPSVHQP